MTTASTEVRVVRPLADAAVAPVTPSSGPPGEPVVVYDDLAEEVPAHDEPRTPVVATVTVIVDPGSSSEDLVRFLRGEGFAVVRDPEGESAYDHRSRAADAAIVDLRLTSRSGMAVCVAWRRRSIAPILAIAASGDEATVLRAFAAGADRVIAVGATPRQVVAHLRSLLRRAPRRRPDVAHAPDGSVQLGEDGRSAVVLGRTVKLTDEEFQVLALLLGRAGGVVTRAELARTVVYSSGSARAVDFLVRRLRERLEEVDARRRIVVVRGVGFRFELDATPPPGSPEGSAGDGRGR